MTRVLILGATGMLGHAVAKELAGSYELVLTGKDVNRLASLWSLDGEPLLFDAAEALDDVNLRILDKARPDWVINAIGVTIPFSKKNPAATVAINGALPHLLAAKYGDHLIHITTDCVYSGTDNRCGYDEWSPKSPKDLYGMSKSIGEPTSCITLRTSIVGKELPRQDGPSSGLLAWFLQQEGRTVSGYTNHLWNGITTKQFGRVCDDIISRRVRPLPGLYHIHSNDVNKHEMLCEFREKFNVKCDIVPTAAPQAIDRCLRSCFNLNRALKIPSFHEMVGAL